MPPVLGRAETHPGAAMYAHIPNSSRIIGIVDGSECPHISEYMNGKRPPFFARLLYEYEDETEVFLLCIVLSAVISFWPGAGPG
jgi:hypothetical protein